MNRDNFPSLTGVRAIAAYMVFIHHFNPFNVAFFGETIHGFFAEFHIGVTVFFVLSGFLIANRYFDVNNFSFKAYFIKRFARIYPMYFILTTVTFLFWVVFNNQTNLENLTTYFYNITFLKGFSNDLKFTGISQSWSLTVEEVFYILAPIFFLFIKRSKSFLIVLPIVLLGFGCLMVSISTHFNVSGFMNSIDFMLDFTFFGRVFEFFIGIGLALFIKNYNTIFNFKHITFISIVSILACVYWLSILITPNGFGTDCFLGKTINTLILPIFGIAPLFFGLITENTFISRFLASKPMLVLGKSSYIFYLIHMGIFVTILNKISENQIFIFVAINCIAVILYSFVEKPINSWIRKRS